MGFKRLLPRSDRLGVAGIFWGFIGLAVAYLVIASSPVPTARGLVFLTILPLVTLFLGSQCLPPPPESLAGNEVLFQLRLSGLLTVSLNPFIPWMLFSSRNIYLSICALGALLAMVVFLQRLCEYIRLQYLSRPASTRALHAHRVKQLVQFFLVTPVTVAGIIITLRQHHYQLKSSFLIEITWHQTPGIIKVSIIAALAVTLLALLTLIIRFLFESNPPPTDSPTQPKEPM